MLPFLKGLVIRIYWGCASLGIAKQVQGLQSRYRDCKANTGSAKPEQLVKSMCKASTVTSTGWHTSRKICIAAASVINLAVPALLGMN